jgi:hypothetical protein
MGPEQVPPARRALGRATDAALAGAATVQAVVLALLLPGLPAARLELPVLASFGAPVAAGADGADPPIAVTLPVATVEPLAAALVLFVLHAIGRVAALAGPRHARLVGWVEWSQASAIVLFLVAQLNGIAEVAALVPLYAITAGAALLLAIDRPARGLRRPAAVAAIVGIVPWGVVAFAQLGAGIATEPVPIAVRVLTLAMLSIAVIAWWVAWRHPFASTEPGRTATDVAMPVLGLTATTILAWGLAIGFA